MPEDAMRVGEAVAGQFQIEHVGDVGGMGCVYRARDLCTGKPIALKIPRCDGALAAERFAREAEVLSSLRHPGIVRCVGYGEIAQGKPYLAMEWLEGETLHQRLKRDRLTVAEGVALGLRLASALGAVHRRGIVHRDLKPG